MLCWAFNANFTNASRRTTQESSFHDMHDMPVETRRKETNCVTHVYAHCVTHVCAPCREGELFSVISVLDHGEGGRSAHCLSSRPKIHAATSRVLVLATCTFLALSIILGHAKDIT